MRGVQRMKVCNSRMVTSFVLVFWIGKIIARAARRGAGKSGAHHAGYLSCCTG